MAKKSTTTHNKAISDINSLRKSLLNFRFQKHTGQLEKTSEIKKTRRKIAKLLTNLNKEKGLKNA